MLEGFKALLGSEKALAGGMLIIAATVLAAMGLMSIPDWQSYTQVIFGTYVAGKTVQGAVSAVAHRETKTKTETKVTVAAEATDAR
jgi:hypothetical protein